MAGQPGARRIAYLTSEFPTVSHTFILREIEGLRAAGHAVLPCSVRKTAAAQHKGPAERAMAAETFNIIATARRPGRLLAALGWALARPGRLARVLGQALSVSVPGLRGRGYALIYTVEAVVLAHHLTRAGAGHLHTHFANAGATVGMLAARLAGLDFSFTLHGPSDLREPERMRLDAKISAARFVACISHYARSQAMLNSDPVHWDKLRIVHCGVQPARYAEAPDAAAQPPALIFVGRLAPVKGLRVLLDAFAMARDAVPRMTLTIVGDGPERAWLESRAKDFGGALRLTGALSQDEVAAELARARAMVLPSFAEGVPVVLMEAMASGRAVIATRITGVPELVEDGVSGRLVPAGDAEALARAMVEIARDGALAAAMGAAGRRKVAAEFDIAVEVARLVTLFEVPKDTVASTPR
jgi:glycosyltransferase involved in cell wall biosynthesis